MDTTPYALSDSSESSSNHGSSSSRSRPPSPSPSLLERYNAAISARLDLSSTASPSSHAVPKVAEDDADDDAGPGSRPMTKAEKQKLKNKRRKEREKAIRAQGASINVPTSTSQLLVHLGCKDRLRRSGGHAALFKSGCQAGISCPA